MTSRTNVLVIDSGARGQTLAWECEESTLVGDVYNAPGNAGQYGTSMPELKENDREGILRFAKEKNIGLVIIGPEKPLVEGLADFLRENNIPTFGPSKAAAQLEGSKLFTNKICKENRIPKAEYEIGESKVETMRIIDKWDAPIVIKRDGLCGGKGVTVPENMEEAETAVSVAFETDPFVIIEERLFGEEFSVFAFCDGTNVTLIPMAAQDFKRAGDGDSGKNTGGMGAYAPLRKVPPVVLEYLKVHFFLPTIRAMEARGTPFTGLLYGGFIWTREGIFLIEYNVRFGDPEVVVLFLLAISDMVQYKLATLEPGALSQLPPIQMVWDQVAVTRVLVSKGYPEKYETGQRIEGLFAAGKIARLFHAGTKFIPPRVTVVNGGRVINVAARGKTFPIVRKKIERASDLIHYKGKAGRDDIAANAI